MHKKKYSGPKKLKLFCQIIIWNLEKVNVSKKIMDINLYFDEFQKNSKKLNDAGIFEVFSVVLFKI